MFRVLPLAILLTAIGGSPAVAQGPGWEFSGRVLRADTGEPIAGAKVFYQGKGDAADGSGQVANPPSLKGEVITGPDGIYEINGLPPGSYRIRAAAPGFLEAEITGGPRPIPPRPTGQNDLRLRPDTIRLSQMNPEAFTQAHGQELLPYNPRFGNSVFSPDGKLLALNLGVFQEKQETWLYNLAAGQLKLVQYPAEGSFYSNWLGWQDSQLYLDATRTSADGKTSRVFASATFDDPVIRLVSALPPSIRTALEDTKTDQNARFVVEAESSCRFDPGPHCGQGMVLVVKDKGTQRRRAVGSASLGYLFDPQRSVLVFPGSERPEVWRHGLTALDLLSSKQRFTPLPGEKPFSLLAQQRVASGYLIAYWTQGPCNPASTDAPERVAHEGRGAMSPPVSVCFATIPAP
jgi:hypothetical protein